MSTGHVFGNHELTWRGNDLHVGHSRKPLLSIVRDENWPSMWRVLHGGLLSDMVNLTRARDAARGVALAVLNKKQGEEMPLGGPYSVLNERRVA
jgi:hypothetical protein